MTTVVEQKLVPGLIGMSVHTDCAYLQAINMPAEPGYHPDDKSGNRLRALLRTINFAEFLHDVTAQNWSRAQRHLVSAGIELERGGADFLVITSNTGNTLADAMAAVVGLPILDIARPSLIEARELGLRRLGLLSTARTAEAGFYQRAAEEFGITVLLPDPEAMERIQHVIFTDLVHGVVTDEDVDEVVHAVALFERQGAEGVVLACTDLTLLPADARLRCAVPLLDSTVLHALAAAKVSTGALALDEMQRLPTRP